MPRLAAFLLVAFLAGCTSAPQHEPAGAAPAPAPAKSPAPAPDEPAKRTFLLAEGSPLRVRTTSTLSTATVSTGDRFEAHLASDLVEGGRMVAPKGTRVDGRVVESDPGGRVSGRASLAVELTKLHVPGRYPVPLRTTPVAREAKSTQKRDLAKAGIGTGIGAAIGAIAGGGKGAAIGAAAGGGAATAYVLATRGEPATIPGESLLVFRLRAPVAID